MSEPNREPIPLREPIFIKRYSVAARVHHWFTAVTAILLALSGLAFFHPSLFFLTNLFGGPTWTRIIHPWLGVIMTLSFLDLSVRFWRDNIWHPEDWVWIKNLSLIGHHEERLPELRRYNAGQKAIFWIMTITIFAMLFSGIVLWQSQFGGVFSTGQTRIAAIVHAASAVLMVINLIVHVYAAIWFRGTIRAMTRGTVTGGWAWKHHRVWLREQLREEVKGERAPLRRPAQ
jgi:formate dehydrogenase subunit gamma